MAVFRKDNTGLDSLSLAGSEVALSPAQAFEELSESLAAGSIVGQVKAARSIVTYDAPSSFTAQTGLQAVRAYRAIESWEQAVTNLESDLEDIRRNKAVNPNAGVSSLSSDFSVLAWVIHSGDEDAVEHFRTNHPQAWSAVNSIISELSGKPAQEGLSFVSEIRGKTAEIEQLRANDPGAYQRLQALHRSIHGRDSNLEDAHV